MKSRQAVTNSDVGLATQGEGCFNWKFRGEIEGEGRVQLGDRPGEGYY